MKITESTLIPISLVFVLIGGSGWLTYYSFKTDANAQSLEKLEKVANAYSDSVTGINERLSEIRERLVAIETEIKRRK